MPCSLNAWQSTETTELENIKDQREEPTHRTCFLHIWPDGNLDFFESNAKCQNNISDPHPHQNDGDLEEQENKANHQQYFVIQQEESEFNNVFSFVTHEEEEEDGICAVVPDSHHYDSSSSNVSNCHLENPHPTLLKVPLEQELQDLFDIDRELWRQSQLFNHILIKQQAECSD
ncbi:hypothetical protein MBANPS3_011264 [Mucor bainieri]